MKTVILAVVIMASTSVKAQTNSIAPENQKEIKKEIVSEGRYEAKKNVVKLYSKKEKGTVIITSHRSFDVQLYIFDLEGTIMHQTKLKCKERTKVTGLAKGTYTYTIFANDESIEEGQLIIK